MIDRASFETPRRSSESGTFNEVYVVADSIFSVLSQMIENPGIFPGFVVSRTPHVRYRGHHHENKKITRRSTLLHK